MELEFYGAASGVTGSCHILRTGGRRFLLDCGLIQGRREEEERNREPFPSDPQIPTLPKIRRFSLGLGVSPISTLLGGKP